MDFFESLTERCLRTISMCNASTLERIGITVSLSSLPSWSHYAECQAERDGTNWYSYLWSSYIRPWVLPRKQAQIEKEYFHAQACLWQEFLNAILEKAENDRQILCSDGNS